NVVLLLDACREESSRSGLGIGEEKHQGVITFYSCAANQKSWEIAELRHGSFTHTLLTGLRLHGEANCATVERLDRYLNSAVPQLNTRYQKEIQNPYLKAEPPYKMYYILLEQSATMRDVESLKLQASLSENSGNFELAEQIWIRVLGVSRADSDAISAIQRIAIKNNNSTPETIPHPIVNYKSPGLSRGEDTMSPTQILKPAENIKENNANSSRIGKEIFLDLIKNRRQFLIYAGLGGTGLLTAFGLKEIFKITTIPKPELLTFKVKTVDKTGKIVNQENHQAKYFKEDLGNNITLDMVQIPGGSFKMGSPESEKGRSQNESPQHEVNVPGFSMGKFVVTQEQYQQIMGKNPSSFSGAKRPVEKVSWNDAVEFCQKLSQKTGREYRLPSEAEWEYACRGGTTTPFHFGETITTDLANYNGTYTYASEPKGKNLQETTDVGSFPPNAFGLYDMHGNVWEWCQDDWHDNYSNAPKDGSVWTSQSGITKLLRGGSWSSDPGYCRSAFRYNYGLDLTNAIGFRVVCSGAAWT
ncbi:MAG: SUMF1/EgtB/PvdO family nonheme iron enzyme, partial [Dolichospermum sp.]